MSTSPKSDIRLDKWCWAARFFKTRTLATQAIELGRVLQNEQRVKPAHTVKLGDLIEIHHADQIWIVEIKLLLDTRGSATVAQTMYQETAASVAQRAQTSLDKKFYREPAAAISGRPTKRDRRQLSFSRGD